MATSLNMQKVAEAAGVSKSSVSLALRDDPRLALGTRRRIQEVAEQMGYRKNPIVASLMAQLRVSQTPKFHANIALINCSSNRTVFDLHPYDEFRRGIRERADKSGYGVEEFWADEPGVKPARLLQILEARSIKGVILAATPEPKRLFPDHPELFRDFCVSVIGVDRTDPPLPRAASNHFRAARAAVEAMFRLGYRRPALFVSDKTDRVLDRRWSAGFSAGMHDAPSMADGRAAPLFFETPDRALFAKWVKAERPDVIITDEAQVFEWMQGLKIVVPDEIGLMHLDWGPHLRDWAGMRQASRTVGAAAADLTILQITNNEVGPPEHPRLVLIESEFVPGPSLKGGAVEASNGSGSVAARTAVGTNSAIRREAANVR
jgi:DNA-binding LacI/PurR family transcriptional regulator